MTSSHSPRLLGQKQNKFLLTVCLCALTAALIFLILLCLVPILKLGIVAIMYQGAAAVVQPAADKRIVACISAVASGTKLLLKLVLYTLILFVVTVAIVCAASNANYYAG